MYGTCIRMYTKSTHISYVLTFPPTVGQLVCTAVCVTAVVKRGAQVIRNILERLAKEGYLLTLAFEDPWLRRTYGWIMYTGPAYMYIYAGKCLQNGGRYRNFMQLLKDRERKESVLRGPCDASTWSGVKVYSSHFTFVFKHPINTGILSM